MLREQPLWMQFYAEAVLFETACVMGSARCPADDLKKRIEPLVRRFPRGHVERALLCLTTWQLSGRSRVELRSTVLPHCFQLLGPQPGTAEYERYRSPERFVPPWKKLPTKVAPQEEKPNRRQKAS